MRIVPRWRKATWALAIFNVLMLAWLVAGLSSTGGHATGCGSLDQSSCDAARNVGAGIAVTAICIVWFAGFLVLSLIWLMSRPRRRQCPRCGNDVKKGLTACRSCGFDFAAGVAGFGAAAPAVAYGVVPPPPEAQLSPDGTHWWDGRQWRPVSELSAVDSHGQKYDTFAIGCPSGDSVDGLVAGGAARARVAFEVPAGVALNLSWQPNPFEPEVYQTVLR